MHRGISWFGCGMKILSIIGCAAIVALSPVTAFAGEQGAQPAPAQQPKTSKLKSPDDGWLDVSAFLDERYGFVPIAMPITEPAIGYGAAVGVSFIGKPSACSVTDKFARPNMTAVGGFGTNNGTWGALVADVRHWGNNRVQTIVGVLDASVNLEFYGTGETPLPDDLPLEYNLEPLGAFAQAKYRLGGSRVWVGVGYAIARMRVSFEAPEGTPGLPDTERETHLGGLIPSLTYDSRDSLFTPGRGTLVEVRASLFASALGGDDEFQRLNFVGMQYVPLHERVFDIAVTQ